MQVMTFSKGFIRKKTGIAVVIAPETKEKLDGELDAASTTITQWRSEEGERASNVMITIMAKEEYVDEYAGGVREHAGLRESVKGLDARVCFPDWRGKSTVLEFQIG